MPSSSLVAFWLVALALIVVPGPDWAFALGAGLRGRALAAAAGILTGYAVMSALVAAGLGTIMTAVPGAATALGIAGALVLAWIGVRMLDGEALVRVDGEGARPAARRTWAQGTAVSALNPKAWMIFVSLLPQFTGTGGWPVPVQLAVLGLVFALTCAVFYLVLGRSAAVVLGDRPRAARRLSQASGLVLLGVAAVSVGHALTTL